VQEQYLVDGNVIGSAVISSLDGGLLLMYSTTDGKHFLKSFDHFRSIAESWVVPLDGRTANANLLRLKDGRLLTVIREVSTKAAVRAVKGANYYAAFSDDDGRTFRDLLRINLEEKCYYLMNNRLLRTHTGRILLPVCYVPDEYVNDEHFEKSGCAGCFYSDDEGMTWQESRWIKGESVDQLAEPMAVQGDDDVIHMYMRTGCGYLYRSRSHDDGITWEKEQPSSLRSPCAPFCVNYDPYSKHYFAVWDNAFPAPEHLYPRSPICLAVSEDCVNWTMCMELDNDPNKSYGYPMMHFDEKEILITYYENNARVFHAVDHKLKMKPIPRETLKL